jgi:hypothetical protein
VRALPDLSHASSYSGGMANPLRVVPTRAKRQTGTTTSERDPDDSPQIEGFPGP